MAFVTIFSHWRHSVLFAQVLQFFCCHALGALEILVYIGTEKSHKKTRSSRLRQGVLPSLSPYAFASEKIWKVNDPSSFRLLHSGVFQSFLSHQPEVNLARKS